MTTLLLMLLALSYSLAPMAMAAYLVTVSLMTSCFIIMNNGSEVLCGAIIISYTTGMMMLFTYSTMFTQWETKKNFFPLLWAPLLLSPAFSSSNSASGSPSMSSLSLFNKESFMLTAMAGVMVSMVCINKAVFSDKVSLLEAF